MPNGWLPCFTKFVTVNNDRFHAHPSYNGRPWNNHATVKWIMLEEGHLPVFIHTFVDLALWAFKRKINTYSFNQAEQGYKC
jgi:hypothetical protein